MVDAGGKWANDRRILSIGDCFVVMNVVIPRSGVYLRQEQASR